MEELKLVAPSLDDKESALSMLEEIKKQMQDSHGNIQALPIQKNHHHMKNGYKKRKMKKAE